MYSEVVCYVTSLSCEVSIVASDTSKVRFTHQLIPRRFPPVLLPGSCLFYSS